MRPAAVLAKAVCLSVRLSVTSRYWIETVERIEFVFDADAIPSIYHTLCYKSIRVSLKIKILPLEPCPNLWTKNATVHRS